MGERLSTMEYNSMLKIKKNFKGDELFHLKVKQTKGYFDPFFEFVEFAKT